MTGDFPRVASWEHMVRLQWRFFAELRGSTPVDPAARTLHVPRTTNRDVLKLTGYWIDHAIRLARDHRLALQLDAFQHWLFTVEEVLARTDDEDPNAVYACNATFWDALAELAVSVSAVAGAPDPFQVSALVSADAIRNATSDPLTIDVPAGIPLDDALAQQRDAFAELRGKDMVTAVPGLRAALIPRTTNRDVAQLAAFWVAQLARIPIHERDISWQHDEAPWHAEVAEVERRTRDADPQAVYPRNAALWEALWHVVISASADAQLTSAWKLELQPLVNAAEDLPDTLADGWQALPDTLANAAGAAVDAMSEASAKVSESVLGKLAKPLLYAAGGVAGLALVLYFAGRDHQTRSVP